MISLSRDKQLLVTLHLSNKFLFLMFYKTGDVGSARLIFDKLLTKVRDVSIWIGFMHGYIEALRHREVLHLFYLKVMLTSAPRKLKKESFNMKLTHFMLFKN